VRKVWISVLSWRRRRVVVVVVEEVIRDVVVEEDEVVDVDVKDEVMEVGEGVVEVLHVGGRSS
jgi:hypothetical protein